MAGFAMFSTVHFLWLIIISIAICFFIYKYTNSSIAQKNLYKKNNYLRISFLECSKQIFLYIFLQQNSW